MPKTKSTVMIIKTRKAKAPKDNAGAVLALQAMAATEGWALMVQSMDANIELLKQAVFDKKDPNTKVPLSSEWEVDLLRAKCMYLSEVRNFPEKFAKHLSERSATPKSFDPYHQSADEMIKSRQRGDKGES